MNDEKMRLVEIDCNSLRLVFKIRYFISDSQLCFLKSPGAKIYSLASRMKCKLFLPEFFSGLAQLLDDFLFAHASNGEGFLLRKSGTHPNNGE